MHLKTPSSCETCVKIPPVSICRRPYTPVLTWPERVAPSPRPHFFPDILCLAAACLHPPGAQSCTVREGGRQPALCPPGCPGSNQDTAHLEHRGFQEGLRGAHEYRQVSFTRLRPASPPHRQRHGASMSLSSDETKKIGPTRGPWLPL